MFRNRNSDSVVLKVKRVGILDVPLPRYQTEGSAGFDVCAAIKKPHRIRAGQRDLVPIGLAFEIPPGYEIQIRPRSGLALRHGITVLNAPSTIDSDYRGEVSVLLINLGTDNGFEVQPLDRIAQCVLAPVGRASMKLVDELSTSDRGAGGWGSTGVSYPIPVDVQDVDEL